MAFDFLRFAVFFEKRVYEMKKKLFWTCLAAVWGCCAAVSAAPVVPSHQAKGIACEACHTQMPLADSAKCAACHGGKDALSKSNPQHSALKSADVPCKICHQGHQ